VDVWRLEDKNEWDAKMAAKANTDDLAEQLSKLAKMHADGVLTDDEFKALKKKLMEKSADFEGEKKPSTRPKEEPQAQIASPSVNVQSLLKSDQETPWKNMIRGVVFVLIGAGILLYFFGSGGGISNLVNIGTPDIRVTKQVSGTQEESITITNIEQSPITIRSGSINGKEIKEFQPVYNQVAKENPQFAQVWPMIALTVMDGRHGCAFTAASNGRIISWPWTLEMGQSADFVFTTVCGKIVSATFYTDRGTGTYNWK
jgi:Short C-terminal domain